MTILSPLINAINVDSLRRSHGYIGIHHEPAYLISNPTFSKMNVDLSHFPSKSNLNFMAYCSVSPLNRPAAERANQFNHRQMEVGRGMLFEYVGEQNVAKRFHQNFGQLLKTSPDNISMVTNTSEALSMIANGYPLEPGDEIISYIHEYPANYYPWVVQTKLRGAQLTLLSDVQIPQEDRDYTGPIPDQFARGWSLEELESKINDRTRLVALSHVQFTSGFAADLKKLGQLCRSKNVDLVIDAAQGLGCVPLYPEEYGISCVASAGWKWLLGPAGTGVLFTSPEFRQKIKITMSGADHMLQDTEYLDHTWNPHETGRKFEYSTVSYALLDGLSVGLETVFLPNSMEEIFAHNVGLQELALQHLDKSKYQPIVHLPEHRSGILALIPKSDNAKSISTQLDAKNIIITPRDGYLRFAPHLCTTEDEVVSAVEALNKI
ncbi:MAG: aminotransferase class V-fold PLP-dependent enzyme [Planctomycetota bacterium]